MHKRLLLILFAAILAGSGCNLIANQSAPLGGDTAGTRGEVQVVFINNTPFRAVFTTGTYDQFDQFSEPDFDQFALSADDGDTLEGDDSTTIGTFDCGRVYSVGGSNLLNLIEANRFDANVVADAFIEGVAFYEVDPDTGEAIELMGTAPALDELLGVDFPCNGLLIFRFEFDDVGPNDFLITFELIPSDSSR